MHRDLEVGVSTPTWVGIRDHILGPWPSRWGGISPEASERCRDNSDTSSGVRPNLCLLRLRAEVSYPQIASSSAAGVYSFSWSLDREAPRPSGLGLVLEDGRASRKPKPGVCMSVHVRLLFSGGLCPQVLSFLHFFFFKLLFI